MILYKEVIDRGFKRNDLGYDSVYFNEFGYEYFIAELQLAKLKRGEILANWHPETQTIEVMRIVDTTIRAKKIYTTIKEFDEFNSFFTDKP